MSKPHHNSALWPVLIALAALLAGALVLEAYGRNRDATTEVITLRAGAQSITDESAPADDDSEHVAAVDADHERARRLARRGQLAAAVEAARTSAAAHPESGQVRAEIGYWLLLDGKPAAALPEIERAAELEPGRAWFELLIGSCQSRLERDREAEATYRALLTREPDYGPAQIALGTLLRKHDRTAEAIELLERASASGSNDRRARALAALGRAYVDADRDDDATRVLERAIEFAPAAVEVWLSVGRAYAAAGSDAMSDRAIDTLNRAVLLAPAVPEAHSGLASALEKRGDLRGAERGFRKAVELDPNYVFARKRLFQLALDRDDDAAAEAQARALLEIDDRSPEHHFLYARLEARRGNRSAARKRYRTAIERANGVYPEAYLNLGLLERGAKQWEASIAAYHTALEQRPGYREARNNLALVLADAGRDSDAIAELEGLVKDAPTYASAWLNLGRLCSKARRYDQAVTHLERALSLRPGYRSARLNLAVAYRKLGRAADAVEVYDQLVAEQPRYVAAWYNRGIALEELGQVDRARDSFEHALDLDRDHVAALRRLARLETRAGNWRAGQPLLREVLDHSPEDAEFRLLLAQAHGHEGDTAGCLREARVAAAANGQLPDTASRLCAAAAGSATP